MCVCVRVREFGCDVEVKEVTCEQRKRTNFNILIFSTQILRFCLIIQLLEDSHFEIILSSNYSRFELDITILLQFNLHHLDQFSPLVSVVEFSECLIF